MSKLLFFTLSIIALIITAQRPSNLRLLQFSENKKLWMSEESMLKMLGESKTEIHFEDITDHPDLSKGTVPKTSITVTNMNKTMMNGITVNEYKQIIDSLSAFHTRYYRSATGVKAAEWIYAYYKSIIASLPADRRNKFEVEYVKHSWEQPSVICRFKGSSNEVVILGAHEDSINGQTGRAPGADDNASGTSAVLLAFKVIAKSQFLPKKTIEFHNYAAEEVGLRGSNDIAAKYKQQQKKVISMLNLDMCGYNKGQNTIGLATDYVDQETNSVLRKLIPEYSNLKFGEIRCGYACSDHASWNRAGYRSGHIFEASPISNMNRNIHTARDLVDILDLKRALEFIKVGVAFVGTLSK